MDKQGMIFKKRRVIVWMAVGFGVGIIIQEYFGLSFKVLGSCFLCLIFVFVCFKQKRVVVFGCVFLLCMTLGAISLLNQTILPERHIHHLAKFYRGADTMVRGEIDSQYKVKKVGALSKTSFILKVTSIKSPWGWKETNGKILVNIFRRELLDYGDMIEVKGTLHRPYEFSLDTHFSYKDYLKRKGVYEVLSVKKMNPVFLIKGRQGFYYKRFIARWHQMAKEMYLKYLSPKETGIIMALLLGARSDVPSSLRDLFSETGTAHILAISGLHVGIVAALMWSMVKVFIRNRNFQILSVIVFLSLYILMTGARPSVIRAGMMFMTFLMGLWIQKDVDVFNSLSFSALVIMVVQPMMVFDVGFQLSYLCVVSILILSPLIRFILEGEWMPFLKQDGRKIMKNKWVSSIWNSMVTSLAVFLGVQGIVIYYFGIFSPVSILANIFVIPCLTGILFLSVGLLVFGFCIPWVAIAFSYCLKCVLNFMVGVTFLCHQLPFAYHEIKVFSEKSILIYYCVLIVFTVGVSALRWKKGRAQRYDHLVGIGW